MSVHLMDKSTSWYLLNYNLHELKCTYLKFPLQTRPSNKDQLYTTSTLNNQITGQNIWNNGFKDWTTNRSGRWSLREGKQAGWAYDFPSTIWRKFSGFSTGRETIECQWRGEPKEVTVYIEEYKRRERRRKRDREGERDLQRVPI